MLLALLRNHLRSSVRLAYLPSLFPLKFARSRHKASSDVACSHARNLGVDDPDCFMRPDGSDGEVFMPLGLSTIL